MQTLLLKVEDSAMDKVMFLLEHLKDVVKTEKYTSFQVKRKVDLIIRDVAGLDPDYVIMQISKPL